MSQSFASRLFGLAALLGLLSGCSSTGGLGLWSPTFPLLDQAREYAAAQPLPTNLPIETCKTVLPNYFVEPGDELLIEPIDYRSDVEIPPNQIVLIDGTVDLGGYGRVIVAGMTVEQIELLVTDRVAEFTGTRHPINVQLLAPNAAVVYVLGAVSSPGSYPLVGRETVLDAILKAGGLNSSASPCDIVVSRPTAPCDCRVVLPVCYRQITQMGDTTTNYQLQPGDRIYVGGRSLCEELAFWRQSEPCERCCNSRCKQYDPKAADYRNPICALPNMPPLPFFKKDRDEAETPAAPIESELQMQPLPLEQLDEEIGAPPSLDAPALPQQGSGPAAASLRDGGDEHFSRAPQRVSVRAMGLGQ